MPTHCSRGAMSPPSTKTDQYEDSNVMAVKDAGVMTELQEIAPDEYRIVNEYPSSRTGVVVNRLNGTKENMTEEQVQNATCKGGTRGRFRPRDGPGFRAARLHDGEEHFPEPLRVQGQQYVQSEPGQPRRAYGTHEGRRKGQPLELPDLLVREDREAR